MTVSSRIEPKPPVGVIESLTSGFEAIASHVGLALFPAAVDLFLWLGPRLSISPLAQGMIAALAEVRMPDEASAQSQQMMISFLKEAGERTNVFSLLSTAPLGVPSLMVGVAPLVIPGGQPFVIPLDNALLLIMLSLGFSMAGLFAGAIYFTLIGSLFFDDDKPDAPQIMKRTAVNWARLTAFSLLLSILALIAGLTFVIILSLFQLSLLIVGAGALAPLMAELSQIAIGVAAIWCVVYLAFTVHGMVLKNRGVLGAMWDSARLVQSNLFSVTGLFVLVVLINAGTSYLWSLPSPESWLTLAGIGGHAFVSTGLVAATFVFYKDRYRWWTEMRQWLLAQKKQ
ncbi:MAG: hypothetical protein FJ030_12630 [Chloroflexi bacterium]|nr:hypothetical protein [Chloroflexota bacterium]